jgi:hypothetical protein
VPEQTPLADTGEGLAPQGDGWFVVNVADVTWMRHDKFGARCNFVADGRLVAERPELHVRQHPQLGSTCSSPESRARCITASRRRRPSSC